MVKRKADEKIPITPSLFIGVICIGFCYFYLYDFRFKPTTDLDILKDYYSGKIFVSDKIVLRETKGYRGIYTTSHIRKGTDVIRGKQIRSGGSYTDEVIK